MSSQEKTAKMPYVSPQSKDKNRGHRCIDVWAIPPDAYKLPPVERFQFFYDMATKTESEPFKPNSLTTPATLTFLEEATVVLGLLVMLGGPLAWVFTMLYLIVAGTWTQLGIAMVVSYILAKHPLPSHEYSRKNIITSWWTQCLYKYFTYRFVWDGDSHELIVKHQPWIGAGVSGKKALLDLCHVDLVLTFFHGSFLYYAATTRSDALFQCPFHSWN